MNTLWLSNVEVLMEERRADFQREMVQLRLEREALATRSQKPTWMENRMHAFSMWMISTGERLHSTVSRSRSRPSLVSKLQSGSITSSNLSSQVYKRGWVFRSCSLSCIPEGPTYAE